ncbi:MAG: hypothetical protein K0U61_02520 [Alphaproteobacteria bacterium]|nr:hypothetical protein [Alphaproteobacteria bacterium]
MTFPFPTFVPVVAAGGITPTTWDSTLSSTNISLSGSDLVAQQASGTGGGSTRSVYGASSGKYYFELELTTAVSTSNAFVGVTDGAYNKIVSLAGTGADDWWYDGTGRLNTNGSPASATGKTVWTASSDVVGVAFDADNGKIWFKDKNGSWLTASNDADVAAGNNPDFTAGAGTYYAIAGHLSGSANGNIVTANFGGSAFTHSVPSGFTEGLGS